ncbi:MAG: GNAT family N-acetyltransferase [Firmicutes bacterium HGW-Firmicutes-1]|jgi:hypothetical protein|nr:MAG: GNAT family N-acetyltransferase [Firmicutes bacterium HGW-Firmicutes-1]
MLDNIRIKEIDCSSKEYEKALEIRNEVLRKPLGLSIYEDNLTADSRSIHLCAYHEDEMIGTLVLTEINEEQIKMRQVAVDQSYRGQNVGRKLVLYSEDFSKELGYKKIVLHARAEAVGFYVKLGYVKIGEMFIEKTIPHYKMEKRLR